MLQTLLGDKSSCRSLRQAVYHFVSLRRYEQMSVHQAMQGIKLSTVSALQPEGQQGIYIPFMLFLSCYCALKAKSCHCTHSASQSHPC